MKKYFILVVFLPCLFSCFKSVKNSFFDASPIDPKLTEELSANVTLIVKTFERKALIKNFITTVRSHYPKLRILVADDSKVPLRHDEWSEDNVTWFVLPYDSGVSKGRNFLLSKVKTPYFLTWDDDFEFTNETQIERMYQAVKESSLDIVAGRVNNNQYHAIFARKPDGLHILRDKTLGNIDSLAGELTESHRVMQFFVAEVKKVLEIGGWDPELKTMEHSDFFIRAVDAGFQIGSIESVNVLNGRSDHLMTSEEKKAYDRKRWRWEFQEKLIKKHNIVSGLD